MIHGENPKDTQNENSEQLEWWERFNVGLIINKFASPAFPHFAIAAVCIFVLITWNYVAALIAAAGMLMTHVVCYSIEEKDFLKMQDIQERAGSGKKPELCKCGKEPEVCYLNPIDSFYVKCETCGIQTSFVDTIDEAVEKWDNWKNRGENDGNNSGKV